MPVKRPPASDALLSAGELAEVIGVDLDTVHNWLQRDIIERATVGGRKLRSRLFSTKQAHKAALLSELVALGIAPSSASDAVNELWGELNRKEIVDGRNVHAIIVRKNEKWMVKLCWRNQSRGPFNKWSSSKPSETEIPHVTFAVVPISDVLGRVGTKLLEILNATEKRVAKSRKS
jgi:hypothetical protein